MTPPPARIAVTRVVHAIHAVAEIGACRRLYQDVLGGVVFAENYHPAEDRDAALLYAADFMVEPMAPRDPSRTDTHFARYVARYGAGWHSFELKVADGPGAAAALKAAGCRLSSEYGVFFYVRPESTGGILLEVCEGAMPNDPFDRRGWRPDWSAGHPTTLVALDHIACVTRDLAATLAFFTGLVDGDVVADAEIVLPQPARRAVVRLAGTDVAFIEPREPEEGPLGRFLAPPTSGIYALVWRVADLAAAEAAFAKRGIATTREGCVSGGFAIAPDAFLGARHEFVVG